MQSCAETLLFTILGGDEKAIHLERRLVRDSSREYSFQNRHAPLYLTCITPCEAQKQRGFCSYLLTNEEIGTTSNPSCSARRVTTISVTRVVIQATVHIPDCAFSTSSKPERRLFASSASSCERSE